MTDQTTVLDEQFDADVTIAFNRALAQVPAIALPGSGFGGRADSPADVIRCIQSLGASLSKYMRANEALREQIRQHEADLAAVRRVFGTAVEK